MLINCFCLLFAGEDISVCVILAIFTSLFNDGGKTLYVCSMFSYAVLLFHAKKKHGGVIEEFHIKYCLDPKPV